MLERGYNVHNDWTWKILVLLKYMKLPSAIYSNITRIPQHKSLKLFVKAFMHIDNYYLYMRGMFWCTWNVFYVSKKLKTSSHYTRKN